MANSDDRLVLQGKLVETYIELKRQKLKNARLQVRICELEESLLNKTNKEKADSEASEVSLVPDPITTTIEEDISDQEVEKA